MSAALIALAAKVGAPLVEGIIARRLGDGAGKLASEVIAMIAGEVGTTPAMLPEVSAVNTKRVEDAIVNAEASAPEMLALYSQEAEGRIRLLEAEGREPFWAWAWRPAGMWGLGVLWFWNVMILHIANAWFKIALPPVPFSDLLQLSALYMSLYMGGHTVKALMTEWRAKA